MPDYTELYNLEITGDPFSAKYVTKAPEDLPPECVLPDQMNSIPTLPTIEIELPDLACQFDVEQPLIPLPYFCTPAIDGGISIEICPAAKNVSITGDTSIIRKEGTECDYELSGDFELCMPCIPSVGGGIGFGTCDIDGHNSTNVEVTTPVELIYDEDTCAYTLQGQIDICTPCIPTFQTDFTVVLPDGEPSVDIVAPAFDYDADACKYTLKGEFDVHCIPEYSIDYIVNTTDSNVGGLVTITASGSIINDPDLCHKTIRTEIDVDVACAVRTIAGGIVIGSNTVYNQPDPSLFISTACVADGGDCCNTVTINGTMSVASCATVELKTDPDDGRSSVTIPVTWETADGPSIGTISFTLVTEIEEVFENSDGSEDGAPHDEEHLNPCKKKIQVSASDMTAIITIPTKTVTICNDDGETEDVDVLIKPTA